MAALTLTLLAAWLTTALAPRTPVARLLRQLLVAAPARMLGRITRGHVLLALLLVTFAGLLVWQLEGDGVRLLGMMAPEIVGWLTMVEMSVYLDALVAVITLASVARLDGLRGRTAAIVAVLRRPRVGRARRARPTRSTPVNDDDHRICHGAWLMPPAQRRIAA